MHSQLIVLIDWYLAPSVPYLDTTSTLSGELVPILRIFGPTRSGQSCCIHVHNVYPYLCIPVGEREWNHDEIDNLKNCVNKHFQEMDPKRKFQNAIHKITQEISYCFYGYHSSSKYYLKIHMKNPQHVPKLADFLLSGSTLNNIYQPHEAHIPFTLQFCLDHNLFGMGFIDCENILFREPSAKKQYQKHVNDDQKINFAHLPQSCFHTADCQTFCELECDVKASDILNKTYIADSEMDETMANPGLSDIKLDEGSQPTDLPASDRSLQAVSMREDTALAELYEFLLSSKTISSQNVLNRSVSELSAYFENQSLIVDEQTVSDISKNACIESQDTALLEMLVDLDHTVCDTILADPMKLSGNSILCDLQDKQEFMEMSQVFPGEIEEEKLDDFQQYQEYDLSTLSQVDGSTDQRSSRKRIRRLAKPRKISYSSSKKMRVLLTKPCYVSLKDVAYNQISTGINKSNSNFKDESLNVMSFLSPIANDSVLSRPTVGESPPSITPEILSQSYLTENAEVLNVSKEELVENWLNESFNDIETSDGVINSPETKKFSLSSLSSYDSKPPLENADVHIHSSYSKSSVSKQSSKSKSFGLSDIPLFSSKSEESFSNVHFEESTSCELDYDLTTDPKVLELRLRDLTPESAENSPLDEGLKESQDDANLYSLNERLHNNVSYLSLDKSRSFKYFEPEKRPPSNNDLLERQSACIDGKPPNPVSTKEDVTKLLTIASIEVLVQTRGALLPDPLFDSILCVAIAIQCNGNPQHFNSSFCVVGTNESYDSVHSFPDEMSLLNALSSLLASYDPDLLIGHEAVRMSWGFIFERAKTHSINFSRLQYKMSSFDTPSTGRVVVSNWRLLRHELSLRSYAFEQISKSVLNETVPCFSYAVLTKLHSKKESRRQACAYIRLRALGNLRILQLLCILEQASEIARLSGIQLQDVWNRGSQIRVESIMLRSTRQRNFLAPSPSIQQRARMWAPQHIQLVMEPHSGLYKDPMIVLDFQSLYPSIMMAYNYCYSTCVGSLDEIINSGGGDIKFGATSSHVNLSELKNLLDDGALHVSPNRAVFVKDRIREGILPRLVRRLVSARQVVKRILKKNKGDRVLDARQKSIKLVANVIYGYTNANFSGRMPCVEVADAIVSMGRATLEAAIKLVSEVCPESRVVYGDTDSLFVLLSGATRQKAFEVGARLAEEVTRINPSPVKLRFEKVYQPCFLLSKKRYVGYMYESPDQQQPSFDAKGIETVRRDGCRLTSRVMESVIRLVFDNQHFIPLVKQFIQKECMSLLYGKTSLNDLIMASEYRGSLSAYKHPVAACVLARKALSKDPRSEPLAGERVPYVIVCGSRTLPLLQLVVPPLEVCLSTHLRPNSRYYITHQLLPALQRLFANINEDVWIWYRELPNVSKIHQSETDPSAYSIVRYMNRSSCLLCGNLCRSNLCPECMIEPNTAYLSLMRIMGNLHSRHTALKSLCQSCSGLSFAETSLCENINCVLLCEYHRSRWEEKRVPKLLELLDTLF